MATARKASTLVDVAKEAGVSTVVASAVINGSRTSARVASGTRDRVLAAARALRYVPNAAAQSLVRPGMNMLGVAFNRIEFSFVANPYVAYLMEGILAVAVEKSFTVALFPEPWIDVERSAAPYTNRRTDGIIILSPSLDSNMVPELASLGIPLVLVSASAETWGVPAVTVDNTHGARLAAEHLLSLGHRRIGYISGEDKVPSADERRHAFLGFLQDAGYPVRDNLIAPGIFSFAGGYAAATTLLSQPEPPTALFAANDHSALGALQAAHDLGVSVPEQLSLIGFDDIPEATSSVVPLTTIRSPVRAIGKQAAERLIACIAEGVAPAHTYRHQPELIIRASTAPSTGGL